MQMAVMNKEKEKPLMTLTIGLILRMIVTKVTMMDIITAATQISMMT